MTFPYFPNVHAEGVSDVHAEGVSDVHAEGVSDVHAEGVNDVHAEGVNILIPPALPLPPTGMIYAGW
jgi:hypothetical protein